MEPKQVKQIRGLIIFAALVVLIIIYFNSLLGALALILKISQPFIVGGVIAFVINLPMIGIENRILKKWNGKVGKKLKRPISLLLSLSSITALVVGFVLIIVPSVTDTFLEMVDKIPQFLSNILDRVEVLSAENPELLAQIQSLEKIQIDWEGIAQNIFAFMKTGFTSVVSSTVTMTGTIIMFLINLVIALIFSIYVLLQKERLATQGNRLLEVYLSERMYHRVIYILQLSYQNFRNFITGQCVEAIILGTMFAIAMLVIHAEYAILIGVLMAFTALIPIVGAFIGCTVGAFLLAIESPSTALVFIIVFFILQQIEGNIIYPKVVGDSVGLPSIWVLVAVSVGGSLFGVVGILVFIPLGATMYMLLREDVVARKAKKIPQKPQNKK